MRGFLKKYGDIALILIASFATHFYLFGQPAQVVFDETFSGNFLSNYAKGAYFFDVHPPLAKLIMAFFGYIMGVTYVDMGSIGNALPHSIVLLRLIPVLAGTFLPLIVYAICRNINFSKFSSVVVALLIIFENSLLVQSKFILFDVFLLLFGFGAILCYQEYKKRAVTESGVADLGGRVRALFLFSSAILAGAALCVKWTGASFLLLILILELKNSRMEIKRFIRNFLVFGIVSLALYLGVFAIHFALLPHSGPGDVFMSSQFQTKGFFGKVFELNGQMYDTNIYRMPGHQYSSQWYKWPLMLRPIFYWQQVLPDGLTDAYIYLLGNPFVYWFGTLSVIILLGLFVFKSKFRKYSNMFLLAGFLVNFVPFMFIGRAMFLYHYESALIFSIMMIGALLDMLDLTGKRKLRIYLSSAIITICAISFVFFSPLSYGLHLDQKQLSARVWLKSWR